VDDAVPSPPGIDVERLAVWAREALPGFRPPFTAEVIAGGRSNITARCHDADGQAFVIRRPPLHGVLATAHDMGREHRIIAALGPTPVPVPDALAFCPDPDVLGAPFYAMSYVDGVVLNDTATAEAALDVDGRHTAGTSLVDTLVALHGVDVDAVGLGDLARRDELVRRQLKRWYQQVRSGSTRDLPGIGRVHDLLAARVPEQLESTVVHGDYRLGNTIVDRTGAVIAVLDWEICTLGDPMADVGYMLATWTERDDHLGWDPHMPSVAPGFATREQLLARYADRSRRDVSDIAFFLAFSYWKLACILEGVYMRMLQGARGERGDDTDADAMRDRVDACVTLAEHHAAAL
jgi:aminoglycoside phosphotransferase (APT) family kinase protein